MSTPARLQVLIVDDEPVARDYLRELLESEGVDVVGECRNGEEAARWLAERRVDLLFLDVRMPKVDGFDMLRALAPERRPPVVFVTAHAEHAADAFEIEALDYLLKPFDRERLCRTLARARQHLAGTANESVARRLDAIERDLRGDEPGRIAIKDGAETLLVAPETIDWIEAESNYVRLHIGSRSHLTRLSLSELEQRLAPRRFVRIHRGTVVNVDRIVKLRATGHGDATVTLRSGRELALSRRYREQLQRVLAID